MWSTKNIRFREKYIEKQPKTSQNSLFSAVFLVEVWRCSICEDILLLRLTSELVDLRKVYANSILLRRAKFSSATPTKKKTDNLGGCLFSFWSKCGDSNSRPPVPETGALPTALHLDLVIFMRFSVSGQTCGQTENLRTFKTSGEPKKSVLVGGVSVFQNFRFESGGLHPKLARYHLRYASKLISALILYQNDRDLSSDFFVKKGDLGKKLEM